MLGPILTGWVVGVVLVAFPFLPCQAHDLNAQFKKDQKGAGEEHLTDYVRRGHEGGSHEYEDNGQSPLSGQSLVAYQAYLSQKEEQDRHLENQSESHEQPGSKTEILTNSRHRLEGALGESHEEFEDTPIIDHAAYPLFGNNWFVMEYLKEGDLEKCATYVSWLLRATKGYTIKIVNPAGTEAWAWGGNVHGINDPAPYFDVTGADIIKGLAEVNEMLGLPHAIHLHCNDLGHPGNYETTIASFDVPKGIKPNPKTGS